MWTRSNELAGGLKLLRDIFAYVDVQIVVYTLGENGVHALSAEGDAEFYADDGIERYIEEFLLEDRELETDFTKDFKPCQPTCDEQFPVLRAKDHNNRLIDHYLQYQPKKLINYVKEFDFQYSDITDEEMVLLIDMLIDARDVCSQHKFDVGKTRQNFHVTLKPNVELKRQRPCKFPLHLKENLEKLLTQLKDADISLEMGGDDEMGSLIVNPIILMPKNDYVKLMIDTRYLNSVTDLTNYSWPLEPVQMIMTRVNGKVFSVSDLSCAYHQVPLSPETQKLTNFIIGGKQYTYTRGLNGLRGLPNFFSRPMTIHFDPLIKEKQAITYIDDTIPRDIEFYDEHGSPVTYRIQHDDNPNDTCNNFYPIHCQQGNDNKVLRLHKVGEKFTLNSLSNEFPTATIQSPTDCFRLGRTINQFRRLCLPSTQSLSSVEDSESTYSSINSLNTNEDDNAFDETYDNEDDAATDDDEDNLICEINTHANHYRLCKAKAAHDAVLGKIDASLAKKPLTANEAPHLDTKSLIAKLDDVAKTVDLDVSTILAEQIKDPVLGIVRSWLRKRISPETKSPDIQQSKGLLRYCQEFHRLLIEEEGQLLCYNEPTDKLDDENLRFCLPYHYS